MILHTRLMINTLDGYPANENELIKKLEELPHELSDIYSKCLSEIKSDQTIIDFVVGIFQWLAVCAQLPTVDQLWAVDTARRPEAESGVLRINFEKSLRAHCIPLIEIREGIVDFSHTTVRQFLENDSTESEVTSCREEFRLSQSKSHTFATSVCLGHLTRPHFSTTSTEADAFEVETLQEYAVMQWPYHGKRAGWPALLDYEQRLGIEAAVLFFTPKPFEEWLKARATCDIFFTSVFQFYKMENFSTTPLHVAVYLDFWKLASTFLEYINDRDGSGSTPLHIASQRNSTDVVKDLIQNGARIDMADNIGQYPLHRAVRQGHNTVIKELLKIGHQEAGLYKKDNANRTPFDIAYEESQAESLRILLERDGDFKAHGMDIQYLLCEAIGEGKTNMVQVFLHYDTSLIKLCGDGVYQAVKRKRVDVLECLYKFGVEMSGQYEDGRTVLHVAAGSGNADFVQCLLTGRWMHPSPDREDATSLEQTIFQDVLPDPNFELTSKLDVQDNEGKTALHRAVFNVSADVVELLLEAGADATVRNKEGMTALMTALRTGCHNAACVLIKSPKAKNNFKGHRGAEALRSATWSYHEEAAEMIDLLVLHGAQADSRCKDGGTALHYRKYARFNTSGVEALIRHGCPLDVQNNNGKTVLDYTLDSDTMNENEAFILILLQAGAAFGWGHLNHLKKAIFNDYTTSACQMLDRNRALVHERDELGRTALHWAALHNSRDGVSMLIGYGANTQAVDANMRTPSDLTRSNKCRVLLGATELEVVDASGKTALHLAVLDRNLSDVKQLLPARALHFHPCAPHLPLHRTRLSLPDPRALSPLYRRHRPFPNLDCRDIDGRTPLHYAAEAGNTDIISAILSAHSGPDLNARDECGRTPLHLAVENGHRNAVELLLRAGAEVFCRDRDNRTPAHIAVQIGECVHDETVCCEKSGARDGPSIAMLLIEAARRQAESAVTRLCGYDLPELCQFVEETACHRLQCGWRRRRYFMYRRARIWNGCGCGLDIALLSTLHKLGFIYWSDTGSDTRSGTGLNPDEWTPEKRERLTQKVMQILTFDDGEFDNSILEYAMKSCCTETTSFLLEQRPYTENAEFHEDALTAAILHRRSKAASAIITRVISPHHFPRKIHEWMVNSAGNGVYPVVAWLLENGLSSNIRDFEGKTPLHLAARYGNVEVVQLLVGSSQVNVPDDDGDTALSILFQDIYYCQPPPVQRMEICQLLLSAGASLLVRNKLGMRPLEIYEASDRQNWLSEEMFKKFKEEEERQEALNDYQ